MIMTHAMTKPDNRVQDQITLADILYDFLGTVKAAPHECVIRTGQP